MTPNDVFARALAAALLDGEWEQGPMLARVHDAFAAKRPWMHALVRAARSHYATAPANALGELAAWLSNHHTFREALRERRAFTSIASKQLQFPRLLLAIVGA